jgi:hypothetical protein
MMGTRRRLSNTTKRHRLKARGEGERQKKKTTEKRDFLLAVWALCIGREVRVFA